MVYVDQMSSWVKKLADWKLWCGFDFGSIRSFLTAKQLFEAWLRSQKSGIKCYYTLEKKFQLVHVHALLTSGELSERWPYGSFKIYPYDSRRDGIVYMNKHLGHQNPNLCSEWYLYGF